MSFEAVFLSVFVFGFPLALVLIQWVIIRQRLPWIGMLVGLIPILLFWLIIVIVVMPGPKDCLPPTSCEWAGLGLLAITAYAIGTAMLSSIAGIVMQLIYKKWVWKTSETVNRTGKGLYLLLSAGLFLFAVYFVLSVSGLLYKFSAPSKLPYP